jgi:pyruvate dehydrogenase E1 component beta subunit
MSRREMTMSEAVNEALREEMERDDDVFVQGLGIAPFASGGSTAGLYERFGRLRVRSLPMDETAIVGSCVGAALAGLRPVAELHLADFATCALDEILGKAGKWRYMHGGNGDMSGTTEKSGRIETNKW